MLTKIIDLGYEVPETGEPRVRLIHNNLIKTASTEIQEFWDSIDETDTDSSYLWVIGVSAKEYYGCNNNGDAFTEKDLKDTHNRFVETAHVFLQHVNKDPAKSIGKPVYSWYNDAMHRVELILKIDKKNPNSVTTVNKIKNGEPIFVSMGCFPAGTPVLLDNYKYKNIENITVGDTVITHENRAKSVYATTVRPYTGNLYCFTYRGVFTEPDSFKCTSDHPIYILRYNYKTKKVSKTPEWVKAKDVNEGDYVLIKFNSIVSNGTINQYNGKHLPEFILSNNVTKCAGEIEYKDCFYAREIIKITNNHVENLEVYNLAVEDDESYVVNNAIVHNCTVAFDVCSICGHKSKTRREYCDHLRYNIKKILPDGKQVYALNPNPKFFDISIVAKPADPTAFTLDKRASLMGYCSSDTISKTSAELGEEYINSNLKLAALKKISDIIKKVDGQVVDTKDSDKDNKVSAIRIIKANGFDNIDYPEMPYSQLSDMGVSPAGLLSCLTSLGSPITLGDAAWMSGSRFLGCCPSHNQFGDLFSMLPSIISRLMNNPAIIDNLAGSTFGCYNGELDTPVNKTIVIRVIKPVAQARIQIIKGLSTPEIIEKLGASLGLPDENDPAYYPQFGHSVFEQIRNDFDSRKENFAQIKFKDRFGREVETTPYSMRQAVFSGDHGALGLAKGTIAAALALGSIGAVLSQPTLFRKVLAGAAATLPIAIAASLINNGNSKSRGIVTSEGDTISDFLATESYKHQKTAMEKLGIQSPRIGTMLGMAVPGALALDYAYNQWRYNNGGNPEGNPTLYNMGKFVYNHPVLSAVGGATLGAIPGGIYRRMLLARNAK